MSDTEQERFYSLAGTVFDRENPIIDGNSYFCCTTPDQAKIAVKMFNTPSANTTTVISKEELTRLLAIEEKANKLDEALGWVMRDYEGMCRKGYQASANWKKRVVMAKASAKAYHRVINPIGDKK